MSITLERDKYGEAKPVKPDYSIPWVRGWEHVIQEGTGYIEREREARGWSRDDVYGLTGHQLDPATQTLIEGDYGIGFPFELDHLVNYAVLFETSPGALLDSDVRGIGYARDLERID